MNTIEPLPMKPTVLLAEDDITLRFLIVEALLKADFEVVEASDGEECLNQLAIMSPDIIILDILMPNKNGFDTCQHIKNTTRFKHAPILMMTGLEDELSITTSYEVGATDFIQKPFNFNLFIQRLRYINRNAQMTRELIESRRRIQQAQEIAKLAYWEWDIQNQKFNWSDSIFEMLDIEPDIDKNNINLLLEHTTHEDKSSLDRWLNTAVSGEAVGGISHQINTKNGSILYAYQQLKQQFDESGKLSHLYGAIVDVTEVQKAQEQIRQLAYFDELTKLPNRAYFTDSLTKSIQLSLNQNQLGAIILLYVDKFKLISNTLGHQSGELFLQAIAKRINSIIENRDNATLARLSVDAFAVIAQGLPDSNTAKQLSKTILAAFSSPLKIENNQLNASLSIGISLFPNDSATPENCIRNAEVAAVHASKSDKTDCYFFSSSMNDEIEQRILIENELRHAIENDELKLVYQPQVELASGEIFGAEALLRWQSKKLGFIPSDKFIPIAEETGVIIDIGEWVLRTACKQAKQWLDHKIDIKRIALNVSIRQFSQRNFLDTVTAVLNETKLPAEVLELEITESLLMSQAEAAIKILNNLKRLGLKLSIDDFGTGYSSLAYLKHFPIDHLKIDRAFIQDMNENPSNAAIVRAVIVMSESIGLRVTAEGVETREQLLLLQQSGCTEVQGYYFAKPMPSHEFEELYDVKKCMIELND